MRSLLSLIGRRRSSARTIRGIRVVVFNTRPDVRTEDVFARIDAALGLIESHQPWHLRRMRRDFARIESRRFACRGAYFPEERVCLVELTFAVNPAHSIVEIAATILHEAMHARIHRMGVRQDLITRAREERFCRRAEIELAQAVPGGDTVLERALAALAMTDEEVAPAVDWSLASQRVRDADLAALDAPAWLKRALGRR